MNIILAILALAHLGLHAQEIRDGNYEGDGGSTLRISLEERARTFTGRYVIDLDRGGEQVLCKFDIEGKILKGKRKPITIVQEGSKNKISGSITLRDGDAVDLASDKDLTGDCLEYFGAKKNPVRLKFGK